MKIKDRFSGEVIRKFKDRLNKNKIVLLPEQAVLEISPFISLDLAPIDQPGELEIRR